MVWREGRRARRVALRVQVFLESPEGIRPREATFTENVSDNGVRALTKYFWRKEEELLFTVARSGMVRSAYVVYCTPLEDGGFRVGVAWGSGPINWAEAAPEAVAS